MNVVGRRVFPMLAYEDPAAAIDWLTEAFGFEERGERYVMRTDDRTRQGRRQRRQADARHPDARVPEPKTHRQAASSCAVARQPLGRRRPSRLVDDLEARHARAVAAGANMLRPLEESPADSPLFHRGGPEGTPLNVPASVTTRPNEREERRERIPFLQYEDVTAALDWLAKAFGFERSRVHEGENGKIVHAELRFGDGMIMLGAASETMGDENPERARRRQQGRLRHRRRRIDAHYERAGGGRRGDRAAAGTTPTTARASSWPAIPKATSGASGPTGRSRAGLLGRLSDGAVGDLGDDRGIRERRRVPERPVLRDVAQSRRMIFPERVFGSSGVKTMFAGFAIGPIFTATWFRSSSSRSTEPSSPPFSVTNATIAWPVSASARPQTAASATLWWSTSADSTSIVEIRWPGDVHHVVDAAEQPEVAVLVDARAVAGEVHAGEALPVRRAEARVVAEDPARHRRPRPLQHEVPAAARPDVVAVIVDHDAASTPGNGFVAEPGFVVVTPGSGVMRIIPVSVCHHVSTTGVRSEPMCSRYHIHASGLIGSPTVPSRRSDERSCFCGVLRPPLHVRADRGRRRVQDRDLVALDDVPPAVLVREVRRALVEHARRAVAQRPVDDVAVARHPADVGGAPVDVLPGLQVEDVVVRRRDADEVAGGRVRDALRLRGRAARVQQVEKVLRVHRLARARRRIGATAPRRARST